MLWRVHVLWLLELLLVLWRVHVLWLLRVVHVGRVPVVRRSSVAGTRPITYLARSVHGECMHGCVRVRVACTRGRGTCARGARSIPCARAR